MLDSVIRIKRLILSPYIDRLLVRNQIKGGIMFVKITAKRQVTFPAHVLEALGVKPGDRIEIAKGPDGYMLRPRHVDPARLAPLRGKLRRDKGSFDLETFRGQPHDRSLRD